ncbi:MAG: putative membrane protein [Microgenomates group bacterium GW2011_GWC1_41_20]|uniref:Glycosyltransferase RgtA/B/C/D-like domain-containing protein n=6 Tax=Candidatus Woeseibacteriota TaxID=1752722 RepID=A0A1F8DJY0_9BACT|nr:MAG: putative membrane protein [Candidatus Woesebacteria bacterium GW2011_GWB1_40_12]KKR56265.1 MAG: putative membrane protein [Candidatus Woesebacteria bacterium GW2011_GWF1_40_24]KKR91075.1 MAG: putative membrane protein [Candidatus Woesebacteria bacterium GW2011_GWD1_41_12]KKS00695.1 MAG: putative membrane protein [Microgenomates group bacterium GW2011_GWC1_41_20]KKS05339.1 MAG: putative membrane protein [Candidatus Woesebacteria bacterium GW2011_GWE1_41_24]KKS18656.1 MAG: putative membr
MINYTYLLIGILFTTFIPGYLATEFFLPHLPLWKKIPLYLAGSAVTSTFLAFLVGLIFGLSRFTLLVCFLFLIVGFFYLVLKRKPVKYGELKKTLPIIIIGLIIYTVYFIVLRPAIFNLHNNYFVMSGPNWQDTAMHLSIVESITQGNFPPQAPYFSGQNLSYYYFSDFHAAVVNTLFGNFFPEVLTILNPFWAMTFYFSVFALTYQLTKKKIFSLISAIGSVFYGNLGFVDFFKTILEQKGNYISMVTSNPFNFNFDYLQMVPMSDYFLQNRPMMAGLPLVTLIILLLVDINIDRKKLVVAGVITGALLRFQMFGFLIAWMFFGILHLLKLFFKEVRIRQVLENFLVFFLPSLIIGIFIITAKAGTRSMFQIFFDSFSWGPWQTHEVSWYIRFLIGNLGIGFIIYIFSLFLKTTRKNIYTLSIALLSLLLLTIPLIMKFTLYEFDMLKFYYYLIPLICVLLGIYFASSKHKRMSVIIFVILIFSSSITSFNLMAHSYLNKSSGYSYPDYESGMWVRSNTPQKTVFVTVPSVHSSPTDIGGRLRIISYINWPYSHGFDLGQDNVFSRVNDVTKVYESGSVSQIKLKYGAKYVFLGNEERSQFPNAESLLDKNKDLDKVYDKNGIKIYEIL